jgi:thiamine transport system permease protein
MAGGDEPVTGHGAARDGRVAAGVVTLAAVGVLIGGAFLGLILEALRSGAGAVGAFDSYLLRAAAFTLWQAALSTLLSIVPALFVARALSRQARFPGRAAVLALFAVPLALPAIVAVLGLLAVFGRAGTFAPSMSALIGSPWPGIYGLGGILLAHVFFNLPLASRLFLQALEAVPADQWRLADQLGMGWRSAFRFIEWPVLRASLPSVAGLVFMLCVTSFTIVLTLGGGPSATTLEVAIYQALRFDFDPARAVALTIAQIALTVAALAVLKRAGAEIAADANLPVAGSRHVAYGAAGRWADGAVIVLAAVLVLLPLAAIVAAGLKADLARLAGERSVIEATLTSVALALVSAALAVAAALSLALARRSAAARRNARSMPLLERLFDHGASYVLVVPPVVIGAGWFVLLLHTGLVFSAAPLMVASVNAMMAMPFALRAIRPAADAAGARHDRLCAALGISGLSRLRLIDLPALKRPLATGFAFAMALSLGDLGVIALFGSEQVQTLPYLLLQRMGSYRTADAAGLALLLGVVCVALASLASYLGERRL